MGKSPLTKQPTSNKNLVITLERGTCFGTCPVYKLTVFGNGTVVYEGGYYVKVVGRQTSSISPAEIQSLVDDFNESGFISLNDVYGNPGGDAPTVTTSIRTDGAFKEVTDYWSSNVPQKLHDLEDNIDVITHSELWVGNRD